MSGAQREASRLLRDAVDGALRRDRGWAPPAEVTRRGSLELLVGTMRRGMVHAERVGERYAATVSTLVSWQALSIPARVVARTTRPVPVEVMSASRRGRWIPLASGRAEAQGLLSTARAAATGMGVARALADATARSLHPVVDVEAVEARRASAAGFSRSTRDMLANAAGQGAEPTRQTPEQTGLDKNRGRNR
jgi:hypothetical protein